MKLGGFAGKILTINLSNGTIEKEEINQEIAKKFIGGLGYSIKLAYDLSIPGTHPYSPENPIIIGAGTLVGTFAPGSSRVFATTKMPANNMIGWCGGGGMRFGSMLKNAGFDHLIIKGASRYPVYLKIIDEDIEICRAEGLWGTGIDEASEKLYEKYGKSSGVIAIGQAGEHKVRYSMAMVDRASTFGRGGIGAVFGSKQLKAIVVQGTKGIEIHDKKRFKTVCDGLFKRIRNYPLLKDWQKYGLLMSLPGVSPEIYEKELYKARMACIGCPIGDKDFLKVRCDGPNQLNKITTSASNISTMRLFGIDDLLEATKLLGILDDYGMDMFEFFGILKYLKNLSDKNLLGKYHEDVEEFNYDTLKDWMKKISFREGIGDILADGYDKMIEIFGQNTKELAPATNKGLITYINPKGPLVWGYMGTMELGQVVGIRGPHAAPGGSPTYFELRPLEKFPRLLDKIGIPQEKIEEILPNMEDLNVGKLLKFAYDNFMVMAALGLCARAQINRFYNSDLYHQLFSSATGIELNKRDILKAGERMYNLLKIINIREGFDQRDKIPEQWFTDPLFKEYTGKGDVTREKLNGMVNEYYAERGWDNGVPTDEKLIELDLL